LLYGPRHHGEPAWAGGGRQGHACQWHRRTPGFGDHAEARRKAAGRRITAGEDKAYDTADHVANLRAIGVTPHVTQNQAVTKTGQDRTAPSTNELPGIKAMACRNRAGRWSSAFSDGAAAWHHAQDQTSRHRSRRRDFLLNLIAYNLIRIPKLLAA